MPCFHMMPAWPAPKHDPKPSLVCEGQMAKPSRRIVFSPHKSFSGARSFMIPCGQCIGCRADQAREWAVRCMLERQMHEASCFVTATYAPEHLPIGGGVSKRDHQLFLKRLRFAFPHAELSFFMCAEYGDRGQRPHYHYCFFGLDFIEDRVPWSRAQGGDLLWESPTLNAAWGKGIIVFGDLTFDAACYVGRYTMKKLNGVMADEEYLRFMPDGQPYWVEPVFALASRRPGIAGEWVDTYWNTDARSDFVIIDGVKVPMPAYVLNRRFGDDPDELARRKLRQRQLMRRHADNMTPERLATREELLTLKMKRLVRELEA
jgi:hypothetical protein